MKKQLNFTYQGVKYTAIEAIENSPNRFYARVAPSAKMIRQYLEQKYPDFTGRGVLWVKSKSFANGNSIDVYFNRIPDETFDSIKKELQFFEYYDGHRYTGGQITTDEGYVIDIGTKYLDVMNRPPSDSAEAKLPAPDWSEILSKKKKPATSTSFTKTKTAFSYGDKIDDCSGWELYIKPYQDTFVYNLVKKKNTAPNKTSWDEIRGEVYTTTGFKWTPRSQTFSKWGKIMDIDIIAPKLCEILGRYYKDADDESTPAPAPEPSPMPEPAPKKSKEDIEKAIMGLSILAEGGNENARRAIEGLKILLQNA